MSNENSGLGTAGLVLGILAFFINPLYICSILAFIFGLVGKKPAAWILGLVSFCFQIFIDVLITLLTLGTGAFVFCC